MDPMSLLAFSADAQQFVAQVFGSLFRTLAVLVRFACAALIGVERARDRSFLLRAANARSRGAGASSDSAEKASNHERSRIGALLVLAPLNGEIQG
jgi:hypothetical protein